MSLLSCLTKLNIFEKRAANLIRMHKIALSTLKSALDFNNKLYENSLVHKEELTIFVSQH